jgi:hypothetical protein
MLPGDDEASVFTDGAYCQRRSDSYARGPIPPTLRCPGIVFQDAGQIVAVSDGVVPHSARWTYSSARALARAICSARFICAASSRLPPSKSSMRSRIAGAIEPGSLGGSDPSGPRASRRSPADLWVFYVLDVIGVRLGSLVARKQCHCSNDPNRHTSRDQIVRCVRAIFDYIVQPRDRFGIVAFHQVDHPFDVLNIGVPGSLLGLAGVGLARNILGKQEERAGLRYCSDRQYRFMGPRPSPFLRAPRLVVAQIVGPELLFAKRARP